ncbi:MAG: DUF2306 domain-containing protein [Acidobacteria bacterium]|nr:DUF2306 domain-containing protein [Acidobacteriota bacterium]
MSAEWTLPRFSNAALRATTGFWYVVTVLGQLLFAFTVAVAYGLNAARGDYHAWNRLMFRGYVEGDGPGNAAVAAHLVSAVIMILAGALQLVPRVRARFPKFHRWSGRIYIFTALSLSAAGVYLHWVRGSVGDPLGRISGTLNAVLIWAFAVFALRSAMKRDFATHRRWAIRLFLVVSASYFFRLGLYLSMALAGGPWGFDPSTFSGPFLTFLGFAQYLFPLAVGELYFLTQRRPGAMRRLAMAGGLVVIAIGSIVGTLAVSVSMWVPRIKTAFDGRIPISRTLSETIAANGLDAGVRQYHALKAQPKTYNLDENQLNTLGYEFILAKKHDEAIRVLALNTEAYPKSSNSWDSLAEAYLEAGNRGMAVTNYRKAVALDPKNRNATEALRKLGAL